MVDGSHMTGHILNSTRKERNLCSNLNTEDHTWPAKSESCYTMPKWPKRENWKQWDVRFKLPFRARKLWKIRLHLRQIGYCIATAIDIDSRILFSNLAHRKFPQKEEVMMLKYLETVMTPQHSSNENHIEPHRDHDDGRQREGKSPHRNSLTEEMETSLCFTTY